MKKQNQRAGDSSLNIQADNVTLASGLSYPEVRQVALDVFEANFYKLAGVAQETARLRAEEITDKFISELKARNPEGAAESQDPDFQYSLFTAQLGYARSGEEKLADLLVDLLVDRSKQKENGLLRIVLNESLQVAPKLTSDQLAILSVVFSLKYTKYLRMNSFEAIKHYLDYRIAPFVPALPERQSAYQHLVYAGCGTISVGGVQIGKIFRNGYPGLFTKGFTLDQLPEEVDSETVRPILTKCLHDSDKLQLSAVDDDVCRSEAAKAGIPEEALPPLLKLQNDALMAHNEIEDFLRTLHPCAEKLLTIWEKSPLKYLTLSSVGIAIGHANCRKVTGDSDNLSIWI